jgi:transposase-like protein
LLLLHSRPTKKGYATMSKNNVVELAGRDENRDLLTDMLRTGAQQLIQQAVEAELQGLLGLHANTRTPQGTAGVVRNGYLPERELQTSLGPVPVRIPKVRSKTGEAVTFRSALVPPYIRKTRTLEAALPWLYLKGISSGEMGAALEVLVGPEAKGLSASTVSRLKQTWAQEYRLWNERRLDREQWVYIWADGVYSGLRAEQTKLCALVIIGVNERGEKHFLAIEDGVRASTQSGREVLLNLKSRGMNMPKLAQPKAKQALHNIWQGETKADAEQAFDLFIATYEAKYPKATVCLQKDREELMSFFSFPAKHWQSIRTSNPIESTFGTIRHRTKRSKGCLSRDGMLHMMFRLGMCAQDNWRRLRGFNYLAQVITGVKFKDGIEIKAVDQVAA